MTPEILAEPLSAERFAPFGDVISAGLKQGKDANQGHAVRFDWAARLESSRPTAKPNLVVARCVPQALPLALKLLEQHPGSSQAFMPMSCSSYLVVVAPTLPDASPDLQGLRAFTCSPGQGINYLRGVWHHPIVALDTLAEFAMLVWEDGSAGDCVEHWLDQSIMVVGARRLDA